MTNRIKHIVQTVLFALFLLVASLLCILKGSENFSNTERRALERFPEISIKTVTEGSFMTKFESYTLDQFPFRDTFRSIKALTSKYILAISDNNGIYQKDGILSKLNYPLNKDSVSYAADRFSWIYERYFKDNGAELYISVIPDKNELLGELKIDNDELYSQIKEECPFAEFIDISSYLDTLDYYATDTHWKQECIVDAAAHLSEAMGGSIPKEYTVELLSEEFYGVYYGQAALPSEPDSLNVLHNDVIDSLNVYDWQNQKEIGVYNREKLGTKDPYEVYLSGPLSVITVENPKAENEKELILFRDSFGSSIAPLLAQGYSKVTIIDIRYIPSINIGRFVDAENADVLFLYSTLVLNNSNTIK